MNYQTLKAGDVRKKGDEVRPLYNPPLHKSTDPANPCLLVGWPIPPLHKSTDPANPCDNWIQVLLVGWPILPADLFNAEFRRPCNR